MIGELFILAETHINGKDYSLNYMLNIIYLGYSVIIMFFIKIGGCIYE